MSFPLTPTRGFHQQLEKRRMPKPQMWGVARKATGFSNPGSLCWIWPHKVWPGGQTRHRQPHAGDTHPVPAAPGHPHHRDPMGSPSEHPKTLLCLWGSRALQKEEMMFPASLQVATKVLTPSGPCAVGAEPSSCSIFHQNLYFLIQFRAKCCRKGGEGDR